MNLQRIRQLFRAVGVFIALSFLSTAVLVYLRTPDFAPPFAAFLIPPALMACALGAMIILGNALGKFGPKYILPALLVPALGLLVSYFWLRVEVQLAEGQASSDLISKEPQAPL